MQQSPTDRAVQQAHAADRFAREIVCILTVSAVRLRRLMGRPLGGAISFDFRLLCLTSVNYKR
jgi:hypothetical protein